MAQDFAGTIEAIHLDGLHDGVVQLLYGKVVASQPVNDAKQPTLDVQLFFGLARLQVRMPLCL